MKHSMHIYIVHSIFIDILGFIEKKVPDYIPIGIAINPVVVFILSILTSTFYSKLKKMI